MSNAPEQMQCMEVWDGSQLTNRGVEFGGLDAWIYSKPYGGAQRGGDVYYASSCATGRITRLLLADVSGHGKTVAATAADLRTLMRRFVNLTFESFPTFPLQLQPHPIGMPGLSALCGASVPVIQVAEFVFCGVESRSAGFRQALSRTIDIEVQHRHCRSKRIALSPPAAIGGTLERARNASRILSRENPWIQIERIAAFGNTPGPAF